MVKIDEREKSSRIDSAIKFFEKMGYSTNVETLTVGDYVFGDRICFEYKSASDMIGSIKDGRVFRQARNMKQYEYSYIIVVGSVAKQLNMDNKKAYWKHNPKNNPKHNKFTVKSWLGAFARLETYSDVLIVENDQQCWALMDLLTSKILADNVDVKMIDRPQNGLINPVASYLSCIYVNDSKRLPKQSALKIVDYMDESDKHLLDLSYDDLIGISGIGKKTANVVLDAIDELR